MAGDLKQRLDDDVKTSLKSRDKQRVAALRLILAAVKQVEVDKRTVLTDDQIAALLAKQAKQRRESIRQFQQARRDDLVAKETFELDLINSYLPEPLSDDEIRQLISDAIRSVGASGMQDMGKVMGELKPHVQGKADMATVSAQVKALLS
jgi:uncharacterized protein YqeY